MYYTDKRNQTDRRSSQPCGAPHPKALYADRTPAPSQEEASFRALIRHIAPNNRAGDGVPNKRQRRQLRKLKEVE